jgi:hypothetical protein
VSAEAMRHVAPFLVLVVLMAGSRCDGDSGGSPSDVTTDSAGPPQAEVRGCRERIEGVGGLIDLDRLRDTVVERSIWLIGSRAAYSSVPHESRQPLKVPAVVRSGASVTLAVPPSERQWLRLAYVHRIRGTDAVTLDPGPHPATAKAQRRACHWSPYEACRSGVTAFSGGFWVNFRRAPTQARCATLQVWVGESTDAITIRPFASGRCARRVT